MRTFSSPPIPPEFSIDQTDSPDLNQLRAIVESLRADNARLTERERHIMELIGAAHADRILHDLRNILNERELLRALTNLEG